MQVYCSQQHLNNGNSRFCTHCGEPLPLPVGQIINKRYRIIRQLGQGGFGRTYLAADENQSQQQCVLKEFAPQVEEKQDLQKAKELFEREANVLKKLQHPQIPRFHSSFSEKLNGKDLFFLVQDYIEGDNYYQLLAQRQSQRQAFSEAEVITLLQNILPVLSYLHSQDVVHRDISPDNLILRRSDNLPVLIDFGGVKQLPASQGLWLTKLGVNHTLLGKKGYAPEEQLRQGKAFYSSDLYSLAVTSLVLLTGKEPQHLYDSYQGLWLWGKEIKVTPQLETVLKKMLAYKPSDRYQNAAQVLKSLPSANSFKPANPYVTRIKTMVAAPGVKRTQAIASKFHSKTQIAVQKIPMPVWLRPFAVSLVGTSVVVISVAGTFTLVNAAWRGITSISLPTISLPKFPEGGEPAAKPTSDKNTTRIAQIFNRRQQLEIPEGFFIRMADSIFYTKKPELQGRSLTAKPEDAALRDEWYAVAEDLLKKIEQANLSTPTRRQLGNYSQRNYDIWRQQAQNRQLGNYTINQLNKDTYAKFDRLFPGQQRGKLNQQTYGQIWYAIAADQVSKVQSSN
ncbi:serine/threonine-protein kinase [Fortiea contorta]|uniref:serine/threonine-protein kinase n=1 Tax=Fortiea contorta TaxID=1892405 RepID=UPI000346E0D7|nr:serine/threonine-protein kinase [Fortiea contorta]